MRHGGKVLVDQLRLQGVERVYCVPGESYLAALDGLVDSGIDTIVCRHEGGAAMMAEAHGKLTGRPGVAFVTRGPGATNASAGVHVAFQDSTPMVLFIGQVPGSHRDREAFQEVDYRQMFGDLAKWTAEINSTERIPEYISRAFHVAASGRPGPVVLALPEDMLSASVCVADVPPNAPTVAQATREQAAAISELLAGKQRPLVIVGGGGWSDQATQALARLAERTGLPVGASFRCQGYLDNDHPFYAGDIGIGINPKLAQRVRESDLLLVLGARLGEMTTSGYTLVNAPEPQMPLIHVHADPDELGRVYRPTLGINAGSASMLDALNGVEWPANTWDTWAKAVRQDYLDWTVPQATPGELQLEQIIMQMRALLPDDAVVTNGAGNYSAWLHRYYRYRSYGSQLAPTSGSMGYGLPAAIAAKLVYPDRPVICLAGDGDFQMSMQEFGTALQADAAVIVVVCNNGMFGTIRMHQERSFPKRVSGTELLNPDFAGIAHAYGCFGATVTRSEDFAAALNQALAEKNKPSIIELKMDRRALSPRMVLEE